MDIKELHEQVKELRHQMTNHFVTKAEFTPIQKVVYGLVGTVLVSVLVALLSLVVLK